MSFTLKNRLLSLVIMFNFMLITSFFTSINIIIPILKTEFNSSYITLQWLVNLFGIANCCCLLVSGKYADTYGARKTVLVGGGVITAALVLTGLSHHIEMIMAAQFFLGIGTALIIPSSQAALINLSSKKVKTIANWCCATSIALGLGPIFCSTIISLLSWRWIYYFGALGVCVNALLIFFLGKDSGEKLLHKKKEPVDYIESVLLMLALGLTSTIILYDGHFFIEIKLLLLAVLLAFLLFFIRHESRKTSPIINFQLLSKREFWSTSICIIVFSFSTWSMLFVIPNLFKNYFSNAHYSSISFLIGIMTVPLIVISVIYLTLPKILKYSRELISFGFFSFVCSLWLLHEAAFPNLIEGLMLFGIAWGVVWAPLNLMIMSFHSGGQTGRASATFFTLQEIGGIVGLSFSATFLSRFSIISGTHYLLNTLSLITSFALIVSLLEIKRAGLWKKSYVDR